MIIEYHVTDEDYLQYNINYLNTSKAGKKAILMTGLSLPIIGALTLLGFLLSGSDTLFILIYFVLISIASVIWMVLAKKILLAGFKRNPKKMNAKANKMYSENGTLEFSDDCIIDKCSQAELKVPYTEIIKYNETENGIYIYIAENRAFIVPASSLDENKRIELRTLLDEKTKPKVIRL